MGWIFLLAAVGVAAYIGLDLAKFHKASKDNEAAHGVKVDAGGVLFVQGMVTYYRLPSGERRKVAEFPMDLRPGSADMRAFLQIMDKAREQKQAESSNARKKALSNIHKIAKEENGLDFKVGDK